MHKVGVIGANGQVGAELCLMLARRTDVDLVAICRTPSGSAFLRWQGIACRHGRVADSSDAARLIGDCDLIVNSTFANGTPADIRRIEAQIIRNLFACTSRGATIVHFSTQSVYGDPRPGRWIRWRNPYGRAKLASERRVRREQAIFGKPAYVLRLGHVCGALQEISNTIRETIRANAVVLPALNCSSNTVYTAAILGALDQIMRGTVKPGTYDLMNGPPWTWREVYEYEARQCQVTLRPCIAPDSPQRSIRPKILASIRQMMVATASSRPFRELGAKLLANASDTVNARATAWWHSRRARAEISSLSRPPIPPEHLSWVANGVRFFPADKTTIELLEASDTVCVARPDTKSWPADLPDATTEFNRV